MILVLDPIDYWDDMHVFFVFFVSSYNVEFFVCISH